MQIAVIFAAVTASVVSAGRISNEPKLIASQPEDLLPPSQQGIKEESRSAYLPHLPIFFTCNPYDNVFGYGFRIHKQPQFHISNVPVNTLSTGHRNYRASEENKEQEKPHKWLQKKEKHEKDRSSLPYGLSASIPSSPVISTSIASIKSLRYNSNDIPQLNFSSADVTVPTRHLPIHVPSLVSNVPHQTTSSTGVTVPTKKFEIHVPSPVSSALHQTLRTQPYHTVEHWYSSLPTVFGQSVGIFPYSNIGGCGVPLLPSCSPTIKIGYLIPQYSSYANYGKHYGCKHYAAGNGIFG